MILILLCQEFYKWSQKCVHDKNNKIVVTLEQGVAGSILESAKHSGVFCFVLFSFVLLW